MMRTYLLSLICILTSVSVLAQKVNDPVIMKINGKEIYKSEFDYIYNKNNNEEAVDKKTIEEYIDLFKNFKLKVLEAEAQGLDTTKAFYSELTEYRSQLAKPYISDLEADQAWIEKEYERSKEMIEVAHILLLYPAFKEGSNASPRILPADTLVLFNKAKEIQARLKKGESFDKLVKEYSDDERSRDHEIPGYMGTFSGMVLFPTLEDVIFQTAVGKIAEPVRTDYGYHIMKVLNRFPNPGQINASHILITCPKDADVVQVDDATEKINEIYQKLREGADFAEIATEQSQDPGSAARGGELGWFGYGTMVKEFQDEAFALKEAGDISKPFRSDFGFHIVKLLGKRPVDPFDKQKDQILSKYANGGFFLDIYKPGIDRLKKEYNFEKNEKAYIALLNEAKMAFPLDEQYLGKFEDNKETLCKFGENVFTISDFISYCQDNRHAQSQCSVDLIKEKLANFEYEKLRKIEDESLENRFPEFRNLMKEYREGILMFEISSNEVWNKASEDTEGLTKFFEANKEQYAWEEPHFKGYIIHTVDNKTKKKMQKEVSKKTPEEAANYLLENYKVGDVSHVKVEKGLFKKGENAFVDQVVFKSGKAENSEEYPEFFTLGKTSLIPESYKDVRGLVITDYQNYLEKEWIRNLNNKYTVEIFKDAILP